MFYTLKEINSDDVKIVNGGCQCTCNTVPTANVPSNFYNIGEAKSLDECSKVCKSNNWVIVRCEKEEKEPTAR
jgi:hypothetical protein